jgi:hypothetical protein
MEYFKLFSGIVLLILFGWIFFKNRKRTGILHGLIRLDILVGVIAGFYLIFTSFR